MAAAPTRFRQLRRDIRAVVDGLRGHRAPAYQERDGARFRRPVCSPADARPTILVEPEPEPQPQPELEPQPEPTPARSIAVEAVLESGDAIAFDVEPGQTLLEAGLDAGLDLAFSCTMGGCGACAIRLARGDVELEEPNCLSEEERDEGVILACVARPRGPCRVLLEGAPDPELDPAGET